MVVVAMVAKPVNAVQVVARTGVVLIQITAAERNKIKALS